MPIVEPESGRVDEHRPVVGVSVLKRRRRNSRDRIVHRKDITNT
jgi:hypothetical protein